MNFGWPLRLASGNTDPGYHGISNFVDLDMTYPGHLLDWNCGQRTYDRNTGYNHAGIDFFTWPFSWKKMSENAVEIVAVAGGTILLKDDDNQDQSCSFNNLPWNAVYVQHADGSIAWYGHMKRNSATSKGVGESVAEGEFLGVVGSSGNSTGPHLHLEIYDASDNLIEPYFGSCNETTTRSWWKSQRPYYDSAINALTTGTAPPSFGSCPSIEDPHAASAFDLGDTVYFTSYYRDQLNTQTAVHSIYRPDGSVFETWNVVSDVPHHMGSSWWRSSVIPAIEQVGTWTFHVAYEGRTTSRTFTVGVSSPGLCGSTPATGCQHAGSGKSKILLKRGTTSSKNSLTWNWKSSAALSASDLGTPTETTDFALCLYDPTDLLSESSAPAAGTCGSKPCWRVAANGTASYKNKDGTPNGLLSLRLKPGAAGKGVIKAVARGALLSFPVLPLATPVRAQLVRSDASVCFEATFSSASKPGDSKQFKAKSD